MGKAILKSEMTEKSTINIEKKLFKLTWPLFIESVLFMLLGTLDTFMLARYSDNAVGAVGYVNQVITMVTLIFQIITSGTMIICSQYIGAKVKRENIIRLAGTSMVVNLLVGIIFSSVLFIFSSSILSFMNVPNVQLLYAKQYMMIVGGGIVIQAIFLTFDAILRAYGHTKFCMTVAFIMNIINVILNYTLIFGNFNAPKLGVSGAAIATTTSKFICCIISGTYLFKKVLNDFSLKYFNKFPKEELKKILLIGTPSAGESISYQGAKLVGTAILTCVSTVALNTNVYINTVCSYIYIFAVSVGQGTAILVGRMAGAEDYKTASKLCMRSLKKAFVVSTIMGIFVALMGKNILGFLSSDNKVIELGVTVLFVNILLEPGRTFNVVIINSLRAAGDVRFPVYVGIVSMWIIGVGLAYILCIPLGFGLPGMWFALALDEWVRGIIMYFRWKSKKWYGKTVVN